MARFGVQGRASFRIRQAVLAAAIPFFAASGGRAGDLPVSIGEVSATTRSGEFGVPLRSALRDALEATKLRRPRERYVLSASLVELDAKREASGVRATAVVSMVLRREREQTLHALLRGRATALEGGSDLASARETALRAAVESALKRLPEALRP